MCDPYGEPRHHIVHISNETQFKRVLENEEFDFKLIVFYENYASWSHFQPEYGRLSIEFSDNAIFGLVSLDLPDTVKKTSLGLKITCKDDSKSFFYNGRPNRTRRC